MSSIYNHKVQLTSIQTPGIIMTFPQRLLLKSYTVSWMFFRCVVTNCFFSYSVAMKSACTLQSLNPWCVNGGIKPVSCYQTRLCLLLKIQSNFSLGGLLQSTAWIHTLAWCVLLCLHALYVSLKACLQTGLSMYFKNHVFWEYRCLVCKMLYACSYVFLHLFEVTKLVNGVPR